MKPLQILLLLQASVLVAATATCRNITIPVNISATNTRLPEDLSPASLSSFLSLGIQSIIELPVTGTYDIAATHCVPSHSTNQNNTLHLLLHGSQRDRHYWDGYGFGGEPYHGSNYSWTQRSLQRGYQTLAIDRLCNGASTHADPLRVCQLPANVEVTHALIQAIKADVLGRKTKIDNIVLVAHSYGSLVGQAFAARYPDDISALILTGWATLNTRQLNGSASSSTSPAPHLPLGYVRNDNEKAASISSFYGYGTSIAGKNFDLKLPHIAFANEGTATIGEDLSVIFALGASPQFTGDVFVLTGEHDSYLCGNGNDANCGTGDSSAVGQGRNVFPNARSYEYYMPPSTGHEWNFHYSQDESFERVFGWLEKHSN